MTAPGPATGGGKLACPPAQHGAQHNGCFDARACTHHKPMTTWFVSRHPGALQWMRQHGEAFDRHVPHLDSTQVQPGDTVIGTLPVNLAAQVCAAGARYMHLSLHLPAHWRGQELNAEQLDDAQAILREFDIQPRP